MEKISVYIETSIISYLAAKPSRDLLTAGCQQITAQWWKNKRNEYDLFISELVIAEARAGLPDEAAKRLELLRGISELKITGDVRQIAATLVAQGALPGKAQADALHIATAAVHGIDYLLTWNCRHIDNPATKPLVRRVCSTEGYLCPEICTPIEIMEASENEK
ncbi:type II toxin-antitoxin system VapC family toxin [candidate division TA06 bacterium]|uniref:Type II toxin-antitoxin system VapC family toxin n=1 Tax=candidate division TA06 bacterium TaxID=2250710 RepID=A0A933I834_UNCT6|nr:type II toxin-antitoxin system VapC family toxin [candidate division TA06 bacterium]